MDTVISRSGAFTVLARNAIVQWPDTSSLQLHAVLIHGAEDAFHYALRHQQRRAEAGVPALHRWLVVDTRTLARAIADDMLLAPRRDRVGIVTLNLRLHLPGAAVCMDLAVSNAKASWRDEAEAHANLAAA